jgi:hypothetical protein
MVEMKFSADKQDAIQTEDQKSLLGSRSSVRTTPEVQQDFSKESCAESIRLKSK